MANTLRFKRGLASGIPTALAGEPLFTTDTFDLYIGNGTTNTRFQKYIASGATTQILRGDGSLYTFPLAISSPSNGQVLKYNGTSWVNDSDAGITGSGSAGQVAYFTGATTQEGNNNLFWDATNLRLGIGTNTPSGNLDVRGSSNPQIRVSDGTITTKMQSVTSLAAYIGTESNHQLRLITNNSPQITIFGGGNVHVGGTSDVGQRLQVTGDTLLRGSGNTSATTALLVENSDGTDLLRVRNDGAILITPVGESPYFAGFTGTTQFGAAQRTMGFVWNGGINRPTPSFYFTASSTIGWASSEGNFILTGFTFNPTSGTGVLNTHIISPVINQTGGANGITRGFYVAPTLTSAADWRSIEWSNNTGWGLYGAGTANNYLAGRLAIGTTSTAATLTVFSSIADAPSTTNKGAFQLAFSTSNGLSFGTYSTSPFANYIQSISHAQGSANYYPLSLQPVSGNVLIGSTTDSGEKLQVNGTAKITGATTFGSTVVILANSPFYTGGNIYTTSSNLGIGTTTANVLGFFTNSTERMRLDASGNLGLAVTPSAWGGSFKALQVGLGTSLYNNTGYNGTFLGSNFFYNGTNNIYLSSTTATAYGQVNGQHQWFNAPSGTLGNVVSFTQAMTLDASGNLLLGMTTAPSDAAFAIKRTGSPAASIKFHNASTGDSGSDGLYVGLGGSDSLQAFIYQRENSQIIVGTNNIEAFRVHNTQNVHFGGTSSSSDTGERLQVTGTAKITGASTFGSSIIASGLISSATEFRLNNQAFSKVAILDAAGGFAGGYNFNLSGSTPQHSLTGAVSGVYYGSGGTINFYTGTSQTAGTTATSRMSFDASGNLAVDTNTLFVDATNNRVGVLTTTPSEPLHVAGNMLISGANSFKMRNLAGTDVNVIRAVSGGTSVLSTATLGNNIAIGTQSAHDFLLCSSDTERIRLSSSGWFSHTNATNPSSSVTDSYVQYSADVTAGNAAPHFRTENGAVIKLYQETTAVGNSIISLGGGNSVLDDTTFDGYTLRQIVKALRNQGILA
jgi:hypothetical protein